MDARSRRLHRTTRTVRPGRRRRRRVVLSFAVAAVVCTVVAFAEATGSAQDANRLTIAFQSDRDGAYDIYVMDEDGSNQTRLTEDPGLDLSPAWMPNGREIVFSSSRDGTFRLFRMSADGSDQRPIPGSESTDAQPTVSSDGSLIAFETQRDGESDVYVMPAGGGDARPVAASPDAEEGDPAFSPEGRRIAFDRRDRDGTHVYVVDLDGGEEQITTGRVHDAHPSWSSDGKRIAFSRQARARAIALEVEASPPAGQPRPPRRLAPRAAGSQFTTARGPGGRLVLAVLRRRGDFEIVSRDNRSLSNSDARDLEPDWQPVAVALPRSHATRAQTSLSCTWVGTGPKYGTKRPDGLCAPVDSTTRDRFFGLRGGDELDAKGNQDRLRGGRGNDTVHGVDFPSAADCLYGDLGDADYGEPDGKDNAEARCPPPYGLEYQL